jgi:Trypsin-co-occurring domain 2
VTGPGVPDGERWPLVEMISQLTEQLREAQRRAGEGDGPEALVLKNCTVQLGITWDAKADGGIQFWVVKLGGGVSRTEAETITIVLGPD